MTRPTFRLRVLAFLAALVAPALLRADAPSNVPQFCSAQTQKCTSCHGDVANECVLLSLDLGETTPWTGSMPVHLKVRTSEASPSLSTPSQLKLVLGYTFMHLGPETPGGGSENAVTFSDEAGRSLEFRFESGSSVGVPRFVMGGDAQARLQMVDAEGWATLSDPAFFDLYPGDGSVWRYVASPAAADFGALACYVNPRGAAYTWDDMGVAVLRDASGFLRQVATRTRLADIVVHSATHYTVTVYPLTEDPQTDPDTGLLVPPPHNPVRVLDVQRGTTDRELIVGYRKGTGDMRTYRYVAKNGDWELTNPSGLIDANELYFTEDENGARRIHVWKDSDGTPLRRMEANFIDVPWGWAMTNFVEGIPGDATRTTSWSYFESGPHQGLVQEQITPTGNRIVYEYDDKNRVVRESMPLVEEETLYSYAPVDPSDPPLLCDTRPRCVVKKMQGVEIRRTYYVYGTNGVDVVERVGEQGAAYGGTNVLRTVTTYYPVTGSVTDGLVQSVRHEDGTIDNYAYDLTDGVWTETITHVHEQAPDIVPMRTTRSVRVYDTLGQLVDLRTDLCTIGVEDLVPQADWTPIERLQYAYDIDGNEIRREDLAGRLWTAEWAGNCCGKISETDWQGITTTFAYDADGRLVSSQEGTILTERLYDDLGRVTNIARRGIATADRPAATGYPSSFAYDSLGRLTMREGEDGIRRIYAYAGRPEGGEIRTVITGTDTPLATTNGTVSLCDGRPLQTIFNGVHQSMFVYEPFSETEFLGSAGTNSLRWTRRDVDLFDREICLLRPGFGDTVLSTERFYDAVNRMVRERTDWAPATNLAARTPVSQTLLDYDEWNVLRQTTEDRDFDGAWTPGTDRAVANESAYEEDDGVLWFVLEQRRLLEDGSARFLSRAREQATGLGVTGDTEIGEARLAALRTHEDARGNVSTNALWRNRAAVSELYLQTTPVSGLPYASVAVDGLAVTNRSVQGVATSFRHDALGRSVAAVDSLGNVSSAGYDAFGRRVWSEDPAGARTTFGYDALGRLVETVNALGVSSFAAYDSRDRRIAAWGSVYPELDAFDEFGNRTDLLTWRGTDAIADFADLLAKEPDMDRTRWSYDEATGLPVEKRYADGTVVRYAYTPDGKPLRTTQADGSWTENAYGEAGDFLGSSCSDAALDWTQTLDAEGRVASVSNAVASTRYNRDGTGLVTNEWVSVGPFEHEIVRTYDVLGRSASLAIKGTDYLVTYRWSTNGLLEGVEFPGASVHYDYTPDALDAGYSVAVSDGAIIARNITRNAQRRGLIDRIDNRAGTNALPSFVYAYDLLGRPVTRNADIFGYNERSEVVSAQFGTNDVADLYAYDSIGNRISSRECGIESSYEANELNEYAAISTIQPFNVSTNVLAYDLNGNLLTNGVWSYAYDAMNRLTDVWSNDVWVLSNAYDANARRVVKRTRDGTRYFLYDRWNLVQENFITSAGETNSIHYIWGKDLSGSFQGAGGIGGLVAVNYDGVLLFPQYDNNGNIVAYVDGFGKTVFHCQYNAFGCSTDSMELFCYIPLLYSTKYYDKEAQLLYYGFRFYLPTLGKWLNRDPISELSGRNLFSFCWNQQMMLYDRLGLRCRIGTVYGHGFELNQTRFNQLFKAVLKEYIPGFELNQTELNELLRKYLMDIITNRVDLYRQVFDPSYGWNKFKELFYTFDEDDYLIAITCSPAYLLRILFEEISEDATLDVDAKLALFMRLNDIVPRYLWSQYETIGGQSEGGTSRLIRAARLAMKATSEGARRLCKQPHCCKHVVVTFYVDPSNADDWDRLTNRTPSENATDPFEIGKYFLNETTGGRERYRDLGQREIYNFIYYCDSGTVEVIGDLPDAELEYWTNN